MRHFSHDIMEITGRPCSGKTSWLIEHKASLRKDSQISQETLLVKGLFAAMNYFISGIKYLGFKRCKVLLIWSLKESVPFFFRLNIFRNSVSKFGIFYKSNNNKLESMFPVDEGVSHLPFLFLNINPVNVVDFIHSELCQIDVGFLKSPIEDILVKRLSTRGHKRLKYLSIDLFLDRTAKIESALIELYPQRCKRFIFLEYAANI